MSHPQPGLDQTPPDEDALRAALRRVYAHHFAEVRRIASRRAKGRKRAM